MTAFGSVDWDSEVNTDFEQSYFAGVGAEWELFTGFRRGAAVAAAAQAREAARADLQSLHNRLALDYRSAVLTTRESARYDLWTALSNVERAAGRLAD